MDGATSAARLRTVELAAQALERSGIDLRRDRIGREVRKNPFTGTTFDLRLGRIVSEAYFQSALLDGAIPLTTEGCNLSVWLVVSGPERGHVWGDLRADYEGIAPAPSSRVARVTFRQWYEAWLEACLAA